MFCCRTKYFLNLEHNTYYLSQSILFSYLFSTIANVLKEKCKSNTLQNLLFLLKNCKNRLVLGARPPRPSFADSGWGIFPKKTILTSYEESQIHDFNQPFVGFGTCEKKSVKAFFI